MGTVAMVMLYVFKCNSTGLIMRTPMRRSVVNVRRDNVCMGRIILLASILDQSLLEYVFLEYSVGMRPGRVFIQVMYMTGRVSIWRE